MAVGSLGSDQKRPGLRAGAREISELKEQGESGVLEKVYNCCKSVCSYLHKGLGEVYSEKDQAMISNIRSVLDFKSLLEKVKTSGPVMVAQMTTRDFLEAAQNIDQEIFYQCSRAEMREQYQEFLRKVKGIEQMGGSENFSSMDMMVLMMNTAARRYRGCEAVMNILVQAATMKSVESVVESWISVLEHHSSKTRNLSTNSIDSEMTIAINGPSIQHRDSIVEESMQAYWRKTNTFKDGHFVRKSDEIKSYTVSKSVDSLV